jgi:hypothetical protein
MSTPSTPKRQSDTDENGTQSRKRHKAEDCSGYLSNQESFGLQETDDAIMKMDIGFDGPVAEYSQSSGMRQAFNDLLTSNNQRTANTT